MIIQNSQRAALSELSHQELQHVSGGINFKKALEVAIDIITIIAAVCPRSPHHKGPSV